VADVERSTPLLAGIKAELWMPAAWGDDEEIAALAEVEDGLLAFLKLAAGNWLRHRPATRGVTVDIRWDDGEEVEHENV